MLRLLIGIVVVAAVATAGDYVWFEYGVRNRIWIGVLHGAIQLTAVGGVLGAASGRMIAGLPLGAISGIAGALSYYALATTFRSGALFTAWTVVWLTLRSEEHTSE